MTEKLNYGQKVYKRYLLKECEGRNQDLTSAIVHIWRNWGSVQNQERIAYNHLSSKERNAVILDVCKELENE
ncbi:MULTISPECIES: hypothetical protein [Lactobacillaceae]|uniref:Uncharacterized protein n=1 Tax=Lentilactobacillus rapi TaxID=481723 RepID=A0A512PLD6_9LACO|nr:MULTISPECIES: hypothetical protein [Lactobacillaceae]GEP72002.1 hypothetical protein LRA02_08700 [Lentilactobacillus rapi]